ncbi:MAG: hypothetical protein ABL907_09760 [Hyphomicrobium sp.]
MPDIQGAYLPTMDAAREGMVANSVDFDIISRNCETANVGFGRAMVQGAAAEGVALGAAGFFLGVTVRNPALRVDNNDQYQIGDGVALLSRGAMWVVSVAACVAGNPVYRTATGTLTPTAAGNTLVDRAYFETAAAAGGLARIALH